MVEKKGNSVEIIGINAVCDLLAGKKSISDVVENLFRKGINLTQARRVLAGANLLCNVDPRESVLVVIDRDTCEITKVNIANLWLARTFCAGQWPIGCWEGGCPITAGC